MNNDTTAERIEKGRAGLHSSGPNETIN